MERVEKMIKISILRNTPVISAKLRWEDCNEFQARNKNKKKFCSQNRAVTEGEEDGHASHSHRGSVRFSPLTSYPYYFV